MVTVAVSFANNVVPLSTNVPIPCPYVCPSTVALASHSIKSVSLVNSATDTSYPDIGDILFLVILLIDNTGIFLNNSIIISLRHYNVALYPYIFSIE